METTRQPPEGPDSEIPPRSDVETPTSSISDPPVRDLDPIPGAGVADVEALAASIAAARGANGKGPSAPLTAADLAKLPRKARRQIERQQRLEAAERALVDLLEEYGVAIQIQPILDVGADAVVRMRFRMNLVHAAG